MEIEVASPSSVSLSETETEMARGKDTVRVKRKTLQAVLEQCQRALELISEDEGVFDDEDESKAKAKDVEQDGNQLNRVNPFASPVDRETDQVEQLHKIYKLCGSPSDEYWKRSKLLNATIFRPREPYKRCIRETFKDFPPSSYPLIETLLAIDPTERLTATAALNSEFFATEPFACEPSSLPKYPPSKEMDAKRRDDEARRQRAAAKAQNEAVKKPRVRDRSQRAMPAPEANAELQSNLDRRRLINHANAKSKSEKFPPPHQDGAIGYPLGSSHHIDPALIPHDVPFSSTSFAYSKDPIQTWSGPLTDSASVVGAGRRKKNAARESARVAAGNQKDKGRDARFKGKKSMA